MPKPDRDFVGYRIEDLFPEGAIAKERRERILGLLRKADVSITGGDGSSAEQAVSIHGNLPGVLPLLLMVGFIARYTGLFPVDVAAKEIVVQFQDPANRRYECDCVVYKVRGKDGREQEVYFRLDY